MTPTIRILFATAEPCPTFRVDVTTLFGKFLPRFGVTSDVIAERARLTSSRGGIPEPAMK